jgi:hypothetical protein
MPGRRCCTTCAAPVAGGSACGGCSVRAARRWPPLRPTPRAVGAGRGAPPAAAGRPEALAASARRPVPGPVRGLFAGARGVAAANACPAWVFGFLTTFSVDDAGVPHYLVVVGSSGHQVAGSKGKPVRLARSSRRCPAAVIGNEPVTRTEAPCLGKRRARTPAIGRRPSARRPADSRAMHTARRRPLHLRGEMVGEAVTARRLAPAPLRSLRRRVLTPLIRSDRCQRGSGSWVHPAWRPS